MTDGEVIMDDAMRTTERYRCDTVGARAAIPSAGVDAGSARFKSSVNDA